MVKIKVSIENDLQKSLLATGFPYGSGENTKDLKDVKKLRIFYQVSRFKKIRKCIY